MDKGHRKARAATLVNDDMFAVAQKELTERATKAILTAKTPEDREQRFQEYQGLTRSFELLKMWAAESVE